MEQRDRLTERIIGCGIEAHRVLGPGLPEAPYLAAMCMELLAAGVPFEREPSYPVMYRGAKIAEYRPDLIVDSKVIVEIKSVAALNEIFRAQVLTYMRVTGLHTGLLLNFNSPVLKDGIKRFVL